MDKFSPETRSRVMSRVKNTNTHPELLVRKLLHSMGFRFRINDRKLPGSPDIILPRHRKVIFVHGCFWHGHDCPRGRRPTTRIDFWNQKFDKNLMRDKVSQSALTESGWNVLVIWECQTKDQNILRKMILDFMNKENGKEKNS